MGNSTVEEDVEGGEWVATSTDQEDDAFEVLPTGSGGNDAGRDIPDVTDLGKEDLGEDGSDGEASIPDVSSLTEQLQKQPQGGNVSNVDMSISNSMMVEGNSPTENSHILLTRTYDILISYDKHHAVPRVWLIGYGEDGVPLPKEKVLEDIISDYRLRTVTMEPHPHHVQGGRIVSIHPCKHADVMKKFASMVVSSSSSSSEPPDDTEDSQPQPSQQREFPTEHYMILFLKFMSSVIPTIEYDFTLPAGL